MSSVEKKIAKEAYNKERRKWIDQRRKKQMKSEAEVELDWTGVCMFSRPANPIAAPPALI
jgi:hypothetical protein